MQDTNLQRYHIDVQLGRHASAVRHLVEAGEGHFEMALQLAKDQKLLRLLLSLVKVGIGVGVRCPFVLGGEMWGGEWGWEYG